MVTDYTPAFCPVHGLFPGPSISISGGGTIHFMSSTTNCPTCGRMSEIVPGTYTEADGRLNILLDPSISPEALAALKEITERLQRNEITPEEAEHAAANISPRFIGLFKGLKQETVAVIAAAVISAVTAVYVARTTGNGSTVTNNYYGNTPTVIEETMRSIPEHPNLPRVGPVPSSSPKKNRHERRKDAKLRRR